MVSTKATHLIHQLVLLSNRCELRWRNPAWHGMVQPDKRFMRRDLAASRLEDSPEGKSG